jgi:TonB family protein
VTTSGIVVIEATLDSKGEVSDARVLSGPDELRRATLQSVLQWHYASDPAPPSTVHITIQFSPAPIVSAELPNYHAAPNAPATAATLKSILISGAAPDIAQKVRNALPVHEGDPITIVAYRDGSPVSENMPQIMAAAHEIDEHFTGRLFIDKSNEVTLRLIVFTPPPFDAPPPPQPALAPPQRIRVGGNVQRANLLQKVTPAYPPDAKEARIQGIVNLAVIIGKDGTVQNVEVLSGHPLLIQAATDAVKQWVYKPTLLNGNPVEVVTQVDVTFTLSQ